MNISDIGSTDDTALLCITNLPPPTNSTTSGGNWFAPGGTRVGDIGTTAVPGFVRNRDPMVVRLKRNTGTDPADGIYRCSVDDAESTSHSLYVGLYTIGGEAYIKIDCSQFCISPQELSQFLMVYHSLWTLTVSSPSPVSPLVDLLPLSLGPETPPLSPKEPRLC